MAEKTETIKIRVTEETQKKWKAWADDPETPETSVAGTIRAAMNAMLTEESTDSDKQQNVADIAKQMESVDVNLDPLEEKLDEVLRQMDTLDERMDDISASHPVSDEGLLRLADRIYPSLAYVEDPEEDFLHLSAAVGIDDSLERAMLTGTPKHLADYYGMEEQAVREALQILEEDHRVDYIEDSGYRRYYRLSEDPDFNGLRGGVD